MQLAEVELAWKVPALQLTHEPAATPAYWPAGQLSQLVAPMVLTYDPSVQPTHVDDNFAPSIAEKVPTGQLTHFAFESTPTADE